MDPQSTCGEMLYVVDSVHELTRRMLNTAPPQALCRAWVVDTKHLHLFGTSGLVGKAVKEEGGERKRKGQPRAWGNSENGEMRGSRKTSWMKGNAGSRGPGRVLWEMHFRGRNGESKGKGVGPR